MTVKTIKCESPEEARFKAEAFKDLLNDEQIIVVDDWLLVGKPGEWVEVTQTWDGSKEQYVTTISSEEEEIKKSEEWIEDFAAKTKVK